MRTACAVIRAEKNLLLEVISMLKKFLTTAVATLALCTLVVADPLSAPLQPLPGKTAPAITEVVQVEMVTDLGPLTIDVYPQAAPHAAKRFLELVKLGFYDNTPIFRVVSKPSPFVAQFGINSEFVDWKDKGFKDDPSLFQLSRGTLAFAKAGPDTNSTQVFINYTDNSRLAAPEMNFSAFAKVVSGMELADKFVSVGDPGMGLDQAKLWNNTRMVDSLSSKPTMIVSAKVLTPETEPTK